ncbi:hypothetical protein CDAR_41571 [Caerostris darwini]|uniref:Uncharacterized protein n=1 Tax=Caerostris darwini TaxID=1538125 RepID=A0AAV4W6L7_9ARAC|nr:hypothetical protein CDAR_41571 [Caerostris darwini]
MLRSCSGTLDCKDGTIKSGRALNLIFSRRVQVAQLSTEQIKGQMKRTNARKEKKEHVHQPLLMKWGVTRTLIVPSIFRKVVLVSQLQLEGGRPRAEREVGVRATFLATGTEAAPRVSRRQG